MRASRCPGLLVLALSLAPVSAQGVTVPPVSLSRALRTASVTIPASWAGIWSGTYTAQACDPDSIVAVGFIALDTLCAGAAFGPDTSQYQCSGMFTDTDFDITCTGEMVISPTCFLTINDHLQGTRSGDVATTTYTVALTYVPTLCASFPDQCSVTTGTLTRVGSPPAECSTTPVHAKSWGRLKLLYR